MSSGRDSWKTRITKSASTREWREWNTRAEPSESEPMEESYHSGSRERTRSAEEPRHSVSEERLWFGENFTGVRTIRVKSKKVARASHRKLTIRDSESVDQNETVSSHMRPIAAAPPYYVEPPPAVPPYHMGSYNPSPFYNAGPSIAAPAYGAEPSLAPPYHGAGPSTAAPFYTPELPTAMPMSGAISPFPGDPYFPDLSSIPGAQYPTDFTSLLGNPYHPNPNQYFENTSQPTTEQDEIRSMLRHHGEDIAEDRRERHELYLGQERVQEDIQRHEQELAQIKEELKQMKNKKGVISTAWDWVRRKP